MTKPNASFDHRSLPVPPEHLRDKFVGKTSLESYLRSAVTGTQIVDDLLKRAGTSLSARRRILDFGCGSGRILRNFPSATDAEIWGVDLDEEAIEFCAASFPFGHFAVSGEYPDGRLPPNYFDMILAVSVLTHLDEEHQDRWLAEWRRIAAPGCVLLVSFKDEERLRQRAHPDTPSHVATLESHGYVFIRSKYWNGNFPAFYNDAFHSNQYVAMHWSRFFEIVAIAKGAMDRQNVAIMRRH